MALPSLSTAQERNIIHLINDWSGQQFTWDLMVAKIEVELNIVTTRQTLPTYRLIKNAYHDKKSERRGVPSDTVIKITQSGVKMAQRIERLEKQKAQLEQRADKQRAFIAVIAHVAKSNPAVKQVLEKVKKRIATSGKKKA